MNRRVTRRAADAYSSDEASALRYFEVRRWPNGVRCQKCGSADVLRGEQKKRKRQLWYCHNPSCESMFSVTSGTIMEDTKLPLRTWLCAFHLMSANKPKMSALRLSRELGVSYKTAWKLWHRVSDAGGLAGLERRVAQ